VGKQVTRPKNIARAEKINIALDMRRKGHQLAEIGEAIGYSVPGVHGLIKAGLKDLYRENAQELFQLELERLDMGLRALMPALEQGDVKAVHALVQVHDRYVKLFQLDKLNSNDNSADAREMFEKFIEAVRGTPTNTEEDDT
jgi:hypothetical protein